MQTSILFSFCKFFFFSVPKTLKEFRSIVEGCSPSECLTALQRIHSCNHPSLSSSNKKQLEQFLPILLDFCMELCGDPLPDNSELLEKAFRLLLLLFFVCSFVCVFA